MAPSFEEMSQSIDEIVRRSNPTKLIETVSISVQQQLVLACAWLNLKVIFKLLNLYLTLNFLAL